MNANDFLIMAIPALVALGGGVLASAWNPNHQTRSLIQHFAAGGGTGTILALSLSVELLFLGLALASEATAGWRIARRPQPATTLLRPALLAS